MSWLDRLDRWTRKLQRVLCWHEWVPDRFNAQREECLKCRRIRRRR